MGLWDTLKNIDLQQNLSQLCKRLPVALRVWAGAVDWEARSSKQRWAPSLHRRIRLGVPAMSMSGLTWCLNDLLRNPSLLSPARDYWWVEGLTRQAVVDSSAKDEGVGTRKIAVWGKACIVSDLSHSTICASLPAEYQVLTRDAKDAAVSKISPKPQSSWKSFCQRPTI